MTDVRPHAGGPLHRAGNRPVRLLSVGNFTVDSVTLPDGTSAQHVFGGDCVYAAVGAAIWGADVRPISVIGTDYPSSWLEVLSVRGIRTDGTRRLNVKHGLVAPMTYDDKGRRENERVPEVDPEQMTRSARLALWGRFSPKAGDLLPFVEWGDVVHLAAMPRSRQDEILRALRGRVAITIDLPWWPGLYRPGALPRIEFANAVLLSNAEASGYFPGASIREVGRELLERGAQIVAIKQGADGSTVFHAGRPDGYHIPALDVAVVDPTGAGDAYCGGFAVGLCETGDPETAARMGTVASSCVIEGFGADFALSRTRGELEERLSQVASRAGAPTAL